MATALAGAMFLLVLSPLAAVAQGEAGDAVVPAAGNLVTIEANDASLSELIRMLSRAAEVKIVLGDEIDRQVTVNLPNVDVETALEVIVEAAGAYWTKTADGIYKVTATRPDPVTTPPAAVGGPPPGTSPTDGHTPVPVTPDHEGPDPRVDDPGEGTGIPREVQPPRIPDEAPEAPTYRVDTIGLNYADCVQVALMFGGTVGPSSGALYPIRPNRHGAGPGWQNAAGANGGMGAGNWFGALDVGGGRGRSMRDAFGQLGGFGGGGGRGGGGLGGGGFGGGGLGGGGLGGGGLGGGLGGGGLGGGGLGGGGFGGGGGGFTAMLPEGIEGITAFLDDNALIVRGTPEAIDEFREIVALLDKPVKQVEISVKFVSITTTFEEAFGIDWAIKNTQIEVFNQGFAPPEAINSVVRFATGNLDATLSALEKDSRATVIQEPRVSVQNNAYASVEFTTEIPYFAAEITYNSFGQREVDFTADFIPVENYLDVMPRINADDSVSLFLTPQISNVAGEVEGPNGERIPITTYQTVFTMLRVQDGDTVAIGGLVTKDDASTKLHTPLLSKIPIIGKLFDSRSKRLNDTELLIFVTPRILHDVPTD
jgi:type II secretory pathway component GspD/PulD (secretin)